MVSLVFSLYSMISDFVCACVWESFLCFFFVSLFVYLFFFFKKEAEQGVGELESIWEELGRGRAGSDIVYKFFFNKKLQKNKCTLLS